MFRRNTLSPSSGSISKQRKQVTKKQRALSVSGFINCTKCFRSWDSSVGIATGYRLDDRRDRSSSRGKVKNFLFSTPSRPVNDTGGSFPPGVKQPGSEVDHSPPSSAEVKKMWIYTTSPLYAFMA
jgi:hypothetical protein